MSIPADYQRAIERTGEFLLYLAGAIETYPIRYSGFPRLDEESDLEDVKREARELLEHYPMSDLGIKEAAKGCGT